ncbi:hypothetical protein SAMN05421855_102755 [Ulvibacter litoralis]|uniref:SpoIIAA-like n=1 Tax=Ulvibacter litoralis TaxID=227084 RepID=A0A1G7FSU2_9FLAO|nr:hypothetical protein GCM10008083_31140 [Ulvibacter litoralis]SDE78971.1 hypothetical protein SAMN05421855_102755 [Ulvibacter litoralis]
MKPSPIEIIDLDFTYIEIHEHFLISQIKEGIVFEKKHLEKFYQLFETYYTDKPFVSIADRRFDYTIKHNLYQEEYFPTLLGIGVICYTDASYNISVFEKNFFKGKFESFYNIEDCKTWAEKLVEQYKKKQAYKPGSVLK